MFGSTKSSHSKRASRRFDAASARRSLLLIRWVAAILFLVVGIGKFGNHFSELASFHHYGLPIPGAFAYAVGVLEIAGGLALATGTVVRVAALFLAIDMIGAILVSGIAQGELVSLTLAPVLLAAMVFLLLPRRGKRTLAESPFRRDRGAGR
ncbi:MAG: DoxX family protein [Solirubrobacteraceae bacterium]